MDQTLEENSWHCPQMNFGKVWEDSDELIIRLFLTRKCNYPCLNWVLKLAHTSYCFWKREFIHIKGFYKLYKVNEVFLVWKHEDIPDSFLGCIFREMLQHFVWSNDAYWFPMSPVVSCIAALLCDLFYCAVASQGPGTEKNNDLAYLTSGSLVLN